ncbi:competence protein ComEC [Aphanothece hegewaldii CCALA 016]|uniref:Competence protein ComEC n=1 Tax=Aphanothece hegewaldii CCALA 016 TaxID=2107694 RepID=A0A2T1M1V9_9CHRO|nr:ComEC/Rec2 family competence protein [Aphanothece hegewaldii]PSF38699.1 competence protein ComEC [Aphanothece hegewaldii CCALA 016]
MNRNWGLAFCLSYSIGLFFTGFFGVTNPHPSIWQWITVIFGLLLVYFLASIIIQRLNYKNFTHKFWLIAVIVALFGMIYLQLRIPQPNSNDISFLLTNSKSQIVTVTGKALSESRQTANQKIQFWFASQQVTTSSLTNQSVEGKLYVTLPASKKVEIHANQVITIQGVLYLPKPNTNPSSFNFKAYLARQGTFAGLKGLKLIEIQQPPWGLWMIRQRIVSSLRQGLGDSYGSILGSIVLGRQAVDLPIEVRELFIKTGLAHVFAASGFQVALLLGIVFRLTRSLLPRNQLIIGIIVLVFYVGLTGIQPSILRASLMGIGVLIGMCKNRKTYSNGSLILAGTILLIFNPLWIWDLGFQLSFLATLGLIVTLPILLLWFDWLPPTIATIVTIPLAASVWTFPLLVYSFSIVLTYSILVNIITAPLITIISIGGIISAVTGFIYPSLGSAIAFLFYYPIHFLVKIITFFNHLPGSSYALGKLPLSLMIFIYLLMLLIWLNPWFKRRWFLVSLFMLALTIIPITYSRLNLVQITVLSSSNKPVIIIQDRGKVTLINGDSEDAFKYTIIPFLTQQGINQIDSAITFKSNFDWSNLANYIAVNNKINLENNQTVNLANIQLDLLNSSLLKLRFNEQFWVWIISNKIQNSIDNNIKLSPNVLLWSSKYLDQKWLINIQPKIAIATTSDPLSSTKNLLQQKQIQFYWTGKDGVIQWNSKQGIKTYAPEVY